MNVTNPASLFRKYGVGLIAVWTCVLAAIVWFITAEYHKDTIKEASREAKDYHGLNLHYRQWGASVGGVYVAADKVEPNPYLMVPNRDVTTNSGARLTLVNPAYMTRMVFETIQIDSSEPIINRLVSLKPLNPNNVANAWEQESLKLFEEKNVTERIQEIAINNHPYLQFMAAFITEKACLKCHAHQGYKVGDVRGGMSIAIPMNSYLAIEAERKKQLFNSFALLWFLGTTGIVMSSRRRYQQEMLLHDHASNLELHIAERQQIQEQLEEQTLKLEEEITERQAVQEQLEEQATMLEEEVTERQQAVVALTKAEQFLQTIIDSEPECVKLLDVEGKLLLMNRAGLDMIEAESFEQVLGQCVCPLINEPFRQDFEELTRKAFQGIAGSQEFQITGLKGRTLWLNSKVVPFRDENGSIVAALAITRNVTEFKQSEHALQKSEERFRGIAESLADWIWEVDTAGCYTFSSASSERVLGYRADEIIGKSVFDLIDPHDVDTIRAILAEHVRDKTAIKNLENWNNTKDGKRVCLLTNGVPILDNQGELLGFRGVDSDITEQRTLERQALQQQKLESIGLLAGGIAHDFNNMLVPIFGYTEMINKRHADDAKTSGYSSVILNAAERARELVSRLLSFSRQQTFKAELVDLNEVINSFMVILKRTIRENIEIKLTLSSEPCVVLIDKTQIEQTLLNLAVNAQDAISGTGTITIETGHLHFDHEYCHHHPGTIPGRHVMVAFSDSGSGIDDASLPYIFDPFFTTKPIGHGTGLGLSTIFGVIKQHQGSIDVKSRVGTGTTFTLFFPEKAGEESSQHNIVAPEIPSQDNCTILVVEDNSMVLHMVRDILEGVGHHVITADTPEEALELVRSHSNSIDLLISDVVMPQMNGPELYGRISELLPNLKVLYMSGYAGVVTTHNGHLEEEANFISKPFTIEAFLRKVSQTIRDVP